MVVRHYRGEVGVLVGAVLARAVHAERDGGDAQLPVETPVADAVLAEQVTCITLTAGRVLEPQDLRPIAVGVMRRVEDVHHRRDPGFTEALQVGGHLGGVLPLRSASSGGKRMSSSASASAGTWLRAWFRVPMRARFTVVRQTSSVATGTWPAGWPRSAAA